MALESAFLPISSQGISGLTPLFFFFFFFLLLSYTRWGIPSLPMSLAAEVAEVGSAGLTSLLHFPVAAQVTHQALAFPTKTLQHHVIHGQVVYG